MRLLIFLLLMFNQPLFAQIELTFILSEMPDLNGKRIGIRGSVAPLSWEKTIFLNLKNTQNAEIQLIFNPNETTSLLEYKYVFEDKKGEVTYELAGQDNRLLVLTKDMETGIEDRWNIANPVDIRTLPKISAKDLLVDFNILREAFLTLHPGLYRYNSEQEIQHQLAALQSALSQDLTYAEAYLAISRFAASIRCGHTYANFFNQNGLIQRIILGQPDKLPFAFRMVDKRMIITKNASEDERFAPGTEILSINGAPVAQVLDSLLTLVKADGDNDAKRLNDLQVAGYDYFESFDVYFPLIFPPVEGTYDIRSKDLVNNKTLAGKVLSITRKERTRRINERYGDLPQSLEDLWSFEILNAQTGYLKLGTFVIWNFEMDWKNFLKESFNTLKKNKIANLIIDVRGNEGGLDEVLAELGKYLLKAPCTVDNYETRVRYVQITSSIQPYLSTWDKSVYDLSGKVAPTDNSFYTVPGERKQNTYPSARNPYQGRVYLLVDAANSSATFYLARLAKECGFATLVGQETGGSRRGLNAGNTLFLRLPNSKIEVDIPIFGTFPRSEQPARGIKPDFEVQPKVNDIINGIDPELEFVKKLIQEQK